MAGLLNVGEMGALALHVMVELAVLKEEDPEARMTVQDMAKALHASVHTLQKVTRRLVVLRLLEGARGVNGGLRLAVKPKKVTMLQVLEGVEGKLCPGGCLFAKRVCPPRGSCVFKGLTGGMEKMIRDYFKSTTIAELADMARQTVSP